jgi:hypothetical protein
MAAMRIGVLGTGMVGRAIATRAVEAGHDVCMGARDAANERATAWAAEHGSRAHAGTFAEAAAYGALLVNATAGVHSLDALHAAGADALAGKPLLDVANALERARDGPPRLALGPDESLAERLQAAFPDALVVKALNTMNAEVMVHPASLGGDHVVFVSGDDHVAKGAIRALLEQFGWRSEQIVDLGGIATARGPELFLPLWIAAAGALGRSDFNVALVTPAA